MMNAGIVEWDDCGSVWMEYKFYMVCDLHCMLSYTEVGAVCKLPFKGFAFKNLLLLPLIKKIQPNSVSLFLTAPLILIKATAHFWSLCPSALNAFSSPVQHKEHRIS